MNINGVLVSKALASTQVLATLRLSTVMVQVIRITSIALMVPSVMFLRIHAFKPTVKRLLSLLVAMAALCSGLLRKKVLGILMVLINISMLSRTKVDNAWLLMETALVLELLAWDHAAALILMFTSRIMVK